MHFEHLALNVPDATAMARWYVEHCDMQIVLSLDQSPYMHFLADAGGRVVMEIYTSPDAPIPDYSAQHTLVLHVAFAVQDALSVKDRLLAAGASLVSEHHSEDGTHLVFLRDPWGVPLQLCQRSKPLV